jgi:hypothetical protein
MNPPMNRFPDVDHEVSCPTRPRHAENYVKNFMINKERLARSGVEPKGDRT